jgi:hypothetical protein
LGISQLCQAISQLSAEIHESQQAAAWDTLQLLEKRQYQLLMQLPAKPSTLPHADQQLLQTTLQAALLETQSATTRSSEWQQDIAVLLKALGDGP